MLKGPKIGHGEGRSGRGRPDPSIRIGASMGALNLAAPDWLAQRPLAHGQIELESAAAEALVIERQMWGLACSLLAYLSRYP
jgi:hypothetical protein